MEIFSVVIVDDDQWYLKTISRFLERIENIKISFSHELNLDDLSGFQNHDLIVLDYLFPNIKGEEVLKKLESKGIDTEVIFLSSQSDLKVAVNLMRNERVIDYIVKDEHALPHLMFSINNRIKTKQIQSKLNQLEKNQNEINEIDKLLIGKSNSIEQTKKLIRRIVDLDTSVLIQGETGVGKEVVAKSIHILSQRSKSKFIAVNCSAIPEQLLESELFGYEKGAFTGATKSKPGIFELAEGGTLFLDEIGDMPMKLQAKLLRVLEDRQVSRLGGIKEIPFNCRVVTATNADLTDLIANKEFRSDLYYRIKGVPIKIAPLRDRKEDIPLLCEHFVKAYAKKNKGKQKKIPSSVLKLLLDYNYPGNIRELKSIIELSCILSDSDQLEKQTIQFDMDESLITSGELTLDEHIMKIIEGYLEQYNHNVRLVASKLGIGKSTIYRMLKNREK